MKYFKTQMVVLLLIGFAGFAWADKYDLSVKSIAEFSTLTANNIASGDLIVVWDDSANTFKNVDATAFPYGGGAITMDDGSGASPTLSLVDGTDETAAFSKVDAGYLTLTTVAGDGFNVLVGNLKVGNGTPGETINGEDLYVEGISEFDGTANFDGAVDMASTVAIAGALTASGDVVGDGGDQLYGFLQDQVASTTVAVTAAQCGKTFVSNSADVMTLPEASTVLGCRYTFVCGTADDFDVNPADTSDIIGPVSTTNGTTAVVTLTPSAGDAIRCTDIGGSITLEAIGADRWAQVGGGNGIWTDVN